MEKENNRYFIKVRNQLGIKPKDIHEELEEALGDEAPSYRTVARWVNKFDDGKQDTKDDPRIGRPVTSFILENIKLVSEAIQNDPRSTYDMIEAETEINRYSIFQIKHEVLGLKKITSRYVPHSLTKENKEERIRACQQSQSIFRDGQGCLFNIVTDDETWIYHKQIVIKKQSSTWIKKGDKPNVIVKSRNFKKNLFSIFFKSTGLLNLNMASKGDTINNEYYLEYCLKPTFETIKNQRIEKYHTSSRQCSPTHTLQHQLLFKRK